MGRFYEFTCRAAFPMPFGDVICLFYVFTGRAAFPMPFGDSIFLCTFFTNLSTFPTPFGDSIFLCTFFTNLSTKPTVSGGDIFLFMFLPAALLDQRPPVAPSFVARRKIGEKGVPKGSKAALWILAFYTGVRRGDVRTFLRVRPGAINAI